MGVIGAVRESADRHTHTDTQTDRHTERNTDRPPNPASFNNNKKKLVSRDPKPIFSKPVAVASCAIE